MSFTLRYGRRIETIVDPTPLPDEDDAVDLWVATLRRQRERRRREAALRYLRQVSWRLTMRQHVALAMRYQGYGWSQIALALDSTPGSARAALREAMAWIMDERRWDPRWGPCWRVRTGRRTA